jgi:predicted dehydrogenase
MKKAKGWRYNKAISGGGVVIDYSIHMIDLLHWYFGQVTSLTASTKKIYSEMVEDEVQAKMHFRNGLQATLNSSWSNPNYRKSYMKVEIIGEKAQVIITDQTYVMAQGNIVLEEYTYPDLYDGYFIDIAGSNFSLEVKAFYDYITNNLPVGSDVKNGLAVQKIVDAIYQSSEKKEKIVINSGGINA